MSEGPIYLMIDFAIVGPRGGVSGECKREVRVKGSGVSVKV